MSPEFTNQIEPRVMSEEIVDVGSARFADRLDADHEQAWEELIALGKETDMTIEDLMTPVWADESLPALFRDRAMLLVVGTGDVRKALGQESYRTNGAFAFGKLSVSAYEKVVGNFDPALFCRWSQEAWRYQHETGLPIISDERYLRWNYEFFERGLINEIELDDFVSKIDIVASSPTWEGSGWDGDVYDLDENRFPLLDDVLNARTTSANDEKVREWALAHLANWLEYQDDNTVELPEWLQQVSEEKGRKLYASLINGGDKPIWISWDELRPVINFFGLDIVNRRSSGFELITVHKVDDLQLKEELLRVILLAQNTKASSGERYFPLTRTSYSGGSKGDNIRSIDIIQTVIQQTQHDELKELFELELRHAAEYEERSRLESEERMQKYRLEREASPEYQQQQRVRTAFMGLIAKLSKDDHTGLEPK